VVPTRDRVPHEMRSDEAGTSQNQDPQRRDAVRRARAEHTGMKVGMDGADGDRATEERSGFDELATSCHD
jgi:hypothetical protein